MSRTPLADRVRASYASTELGVLADEVADLERRHDELERMIPTIMGRDENLAREALGKPDRHRVEGGNPGQSYACVEYRRALDALLDAYGRLNVKYIWERTGDPFFPFRLGPFRIRLNDFPDEVLYTLMAGDLEIANFNAWPIEFGDRPFLTRRSSV